MIFKKISEIKLFLAVAIIFNFLYFFSFYFSNNILYSGKDSIRLHYASRIFLYDSLQNGFIPIFTDKMFGNYPIFFDLERGYQNIFNVLLVYLFGPFDSYKILFLGTFIIGQATLFLLLKKLTNSSFLISTILSFVYFYSFVVLFHLQHQNIAFCIFLLPTTILLTHKYIENRGFGNILFLSLIYYFLITFGSLQAVLINYFTQIIFIFIYSKNLKDFIISAILISIPSFLLSMTSIFYFYVLFSNSLRIDQVFNSQGNFSLYHFGAYLFPFFLGNNLYLGTTLNENFLKHEFITYFSFSSLFGLIIWFSQKEKSKIKDFFLIILGFFLLANFSSFFPFDLFRYWARAIYAVNFALIIAISYYLSQNKKFILNYKFLAIFGIIGVSILFSFFESNLRYLVFKSILSVPFDFGVFLFIFISSLYLYQKYPKYVIFLILFELIFFNQRTNFNLFLSNDYLISISKETNSLNILDDDNSLLKLGPSLSGYSQLVPSDKNLNIDSLRNIYNIDDFNLGFIISFILFSCSLLIIKKYVVSKKL